MISLFRAKNILLPITVFVIWLFHISGILGIHFGNQEWFITKSPLNLLISLLLFIIVFPINNPKKWLLFITFFSVGMLAEWLGVNYGLLFGDYAYGENLGPKLDGVPFLIGTYWALLTFVTAQISVQLGFNGWLKIFTGASLMVGLDFLMEKSAPMFDFWEFNGPVPLDNYIAWFVIGVLLHFILHKSKTQGNTKIAVHLFCAQVVFFGIFYFFPI